MAWLTEVSDDTARELREVIAATTRVTEAGCLEWLGRAKVGKGSSHPYGRIYFRDSGKRLLTGAHRASYLAHKGAIGAGLTVHHECYNTLCVNPDHLSLLTTAENVRDGNPGRKSLTPKFSTAGRDACKWGHPWTEENVRFRPSGYSECKLCTHERQIRYRSRKMSLVT